MPIRPEYRQFYTGPAWRETRARILKRAHDRCERCGVPDRTTVLRLFRWWTPATLEATVWAMGGSFNYPPGKRESNGAIVETLADGTQFIHLPWHRACANSYSFCTPNMGQHRWVHIVLTIAHLNHTPGDDRDENLPAMCQWCHLQNDAMVHVRNAHLTRARRKDSQRPILTAIDAEARA